MQIFAKQFWLYPAVPHFKLPLMNRYFQAYPSTFDMMCGCGYESTLLGWGDDCLFQFYMAWPWL